MAAPFFASDKVSSANGGVAVPDLTALTVAIVVLSSTGTATASSGSIDRDLRLVLSRHLPYPVPASGDKQTAAHTVSEMNLLATGIIKGYQVFISSQDLDTCNFHPSCSRFTSTAIRRYGALRGSLLGTDRLMRCHWFSRRQHLGECAHGLDPGRICDHPEFYRSDD